MPCKLKTVNFGPRLNVRLIHLFQGNLQISLLAIIDQCEFPIANELVMHQAWLEVSMDAKIMSMQMIGQPKG